MPISDKVITPSLAAEWLKSNRNNRPISQSTVDAYAKEMRSGQWFNGGADAIVFSRDGSLINGQHRLYAIVKSGATVELGVRTDADGDSFVAMDQGRRRSAADHPCLNGFRNRTLVAGALRFLDAYESGSLKTCGSIPRNIMIRDVERVARKYPEIEERGSTLRPYRMVFSSAILGVFTLASRINQEDARRFFIGVGSGEGLAAGSVELTLRHRLERDAMSRAKEPRLLQSALVIKAWNLYRDNKRTGMSRNRVSVAAYEPFPIIR
jgi:hypothetical protein